MKLRRLMETDANVDMITTGIIAAMMFAIAIPLILGTMSAINIKSTQDTLVLNVYGLQSGGSNDSWAAYNATKPVGNASSALITQVGSFFSIGPIYLIVVVAVGIIATLLVLRTVTGRKE